MNHDSEKKKFSLISNSQKADIKSSYDEKWGLFFDSNDNLWAGSVYRGKGIDVIDMKTKSVVNHVPPNANDERGISMWRTREDSEGRIWGLTQYDLFVSDKKKMNFRLQKISTNPQGKSQMRSVLLITSLVNIMQQYQQLRAIRLGSI